MNIFTLVCTVTYIHTCMHMLLAPFRKLLNSNRIRSTQVKAVQGNVCVARVNAKKEKIKNHFCLYAQKSLPISKKPVLFRLGEQKKSQLVAAFSHRDKRTGKQTDRQTDSREEGFLRKRTFVVSTNCTVKAPPPTAVAQITAVALQTRKSLDFMFSTVICLFSYELHLTSTSRLCILHIAAAI